MSSSYFDPQPVKPSAPAAVLNIPDGSEFAKTGLLSPQVSRILDDLDLGEKSSSDDDDGNASLSREDDSDPDDTSRARKSRRHHDDQEKLRKADTSPLPRGNTRPQGHSSASNSRKQPHFARFHSLRSMLFSSRIEDDMKKHNEAQMHQNAEAKWKAEHDLRRGLNRPKTPENHSPSRESLGHRVKAGLKRMASRDSPPPMSKIPEDNVSTASDDEEDEAYHSDEENIDHSDIEDLVRWVSRRDPPSDGEARNLVAGDAKHVSKTDSGHESLNHSDVEELVRWVSRRDEPRPAEPRHAEPQKSLAPPVAAVHHGYSDASTASDSEGDAYQPQHKESMDDDDVDELVRWVSHREGPNAGPVRKKKGDTNTNTNTGTGAGSPAVTGAQDIHSEELTRWMTKHDDTSGESLSESQDNSAILAGLKGDSKVANQTGSGLKIEVSHAEPMSKPAAMESDTALTHDDVDDLVKWVSRKNPDTEEVAK